MNKQIDLTNLGGYPFTQDTLKFLQESYTVALSAIAKLCGSKSILFGCEIVALNVTAGWISYNGELLPFAGGTLGAGGIKIITNTTALIFDDASVHDVLFEKIAVLGTPEDFNYSELTTLLELQNVWLPGDIKEKYVDAVYEAANFDIDGYGINKEKGWRKLSSVYANSAGAVTVNKKDGDTEFGIVGNNGGTKTNTLLPANLPSLPNTQGIVKIDGVDTFTSGDSSAGEFNNKTMQAWPGTSTPVNNLQPYFVVLKLIKL